MIVKEREKEKQMNIKKKSVRVVGSTIVISKKKKNYRKNIFALCKRHLGWKAPHTCKKKKKEKEKYFKEKERKKERENQQKGC